MNENEQLRRRVAELEKQLVQAQPRSSLELELRRRGLAATVIPDALELLKAEHAPSTPENLVTERVWHTATDPKLRTLNELIDEFETSRSYLFPSTERAAPAGPVYSDGRPVPPSEMTDDELAAAAGPAPEAQKPKERVYSAAELEAMSDLDRLAIEAGAAPKVEQSDAGIAELNAELEARAEHRKEVSDQQAKSGAVPMFEAKKWGKA